MPIVSKPSFSWIPNGVTIAGQGGQIVVQNMIGSIGPRCVLNVGMHRVIREIMQADTTDSGTFGCQAQRNVLMRFRFAAEVVWDAMNPPDVLLNRGASIAIAFMLGDKGSYPVLTETGVPVDLLELGNIGNNPRNPPARKYYYSPSALLSHAETVTDSRGDVIRQNIAGGGNSHLFLLPDEIAGLQTYMQYAWTGGQEAAAIAAAQAMGD